MSGVGRLMMLSEMYRPILFLGFEWGEEWDKAALPEIPLYVPPGLLLCDDDQVEGGAQGVQENGGDQVREIV